MLKFYNECWIMFKRQMLLMRQSPDAIITAIGIPSLLIALFVTVFGGAMDVGYYTYVDFVTFGVLIMATTQSSGISTTASHLDMKTGMIERIRSMPVSSLAFLIGHVLASTTRNMMATICLLGMAWLLGFRPTANPIDWLAILGIILLFMLLLSWISIFISVAVKSSEAAAGIPALLSLLAFFSSSFAPIETLPSWLQGFAAVQPFTIVVDSLRAIAFGGYVGNSWIAVLVWCLSLIFVFQAGSLVLFYKKLL